METTLTNIIASEIFNEISYEKGKTFFKQNISYMAIGVFCAA